MSFLARGALKSRKRFGGGVLEPTHVVEFITSQNSHGREILTVQEARLICDFRKLRESYDRVDVALKLLQSISRTGQEGDDQSADLYNLLGNSLKALEVSKEPHYVGFIFSLKLMQQQGVLELEPWMSPFLRPPIRESENEFNLNSFLELQEQRLRFQNIFESYLKS